MTADVSRRVVVLTTPELAVGYRLAGVAAVGSPSSDAAAGRLVELLSEKPKVGILAVHEPYLDALGARRRQELEASVSPLVVALPSGASEPGEAERRREMLATLWRTIGYQITFPTGKGP